MARNSPASVKAQAIPSLTRRAVDGAIAIPLFTDDLSQLKKSARDRLPEGAGKLMKQQDR